MKTEAIVHILVGIILSALTSSGLWILSDIRDDLSMQTQLLTEHLITHPSEGLKERVIVMEQVIKGLQ
tara:strand:- start:5597 stop:5800 length:204 start_codon:yes stop_codon:yes gene_type:complete